MKRQHARRHQTGSDHDRRGRRLDQRRHHQAENKSLEGIVGHLLHHVLQRTGCTLLQAVAHQPHTVKEHGQAAKQGQYVIRTHYSDPPSDLKK